MWKVATGHLRGGPRVEVEQGVQDPREERDAEWGPHAGQALAPLVA